MSRTKTTERTLALGAVGIVLATTLLVAFSARAAENAPTSQGLQKGICVVLGLPEADRPQSIVELAGSWPDMPSLEEIRSDEGDDVPREPL